MPDTFSLPEPLEVGAALGVLVVGTIEGIEDDTVALRYPGQPEHTEVRSLVPLGPDVVGARVALGFLGGDRSLPLILGPLVEPAEPHEYEQAIEFELPRTDEREGALEPPPLRVSADGQRVRVEAEQELSLCCGKASITLRANGRVIVRGVQIESRAKGLNRIKGGAVAIN